MPLCIPHTNDLKVITNSGIVGSTTPGTGLPSSATTLNYGTVTQLISAANNTQDSWGIEVTILETGASATSSEASVDILIGGATDDVLISSLLCANVYAGTSRSYFFPIHIPAGVRIAARLASVRTSITAQIIVSLYGGGAPPFRIGRKVTTYGTKINNARGVAITPAASGATASATQVTASTSEDHFAFNVGFQIVTTTVALRNYAIGIGVGASTEERMGQTWWHLADTGEKATTFPTMCHWADVPAGTRLALLVSNSGTNGTAYDGHVYAIS